MSECKELENESMLRFNSMKIKNSIDVTNYRYKVSIKSNLQIRDILIKRDFLKLKGHLEEISKLVKKDYNNIEELYKDRDILLKNKQVYEILKNNVFAGRVSLKFWRIECGENDQNLYHIKKRIHEAPFYNRNIISSLNLNNIKNAEPYTCLKLKSGKYLLRLIVAAGTKSNDDGIETVSTPNNKNIVCIIDLNMKYIEVRADYKTSKIVIENLKKKLELNGIVEIKILSKYSNSIEKFKKSLDNARFINVKSIPSNELPLTNEQTDMLVNTLKALDIFYTDKNYEELVKNLKKIDISSNEIGFIPLLLTGLSKIGISSKLDNIGDITSQPMYKLLEECLLHQSGYLRITDYRGIEYSVQVGINTDNIIFKNNSTDEDFINQIRKKLITSNDKNEQEVNEYMVNEYEVEEAIREIADSGIRSFYLQYFANVLNIDICHALNLLNNFIEKSKKVYIKYEIRCAKCYEEIDKSVDDIRKIPFNDIYHCIDCDNEISVSKDNIYMSYNISEAWIESINKKVNLRPRAKELDEEKVSIASENIPQFSLDMLEKMGLTKFSTDQSSILCIENLNINNGQTMSMGNQNQLL